MNTDTLIDAVSKLNWQTIIGIFIVVWYFTKENKKLTEELLLEVKAIHKDLKTMNTRISRVEGTVYGKSSYEEIDKD